MIEIEVLICSVATGNINGDDDPQALLAVTEISPLVFPDIALRKLVVDTPDHPGGRDQV